jgi:acyl carrier protein
MPMGASPPEFVAARTLVARALSVDVDLIGPETTMYGIPTWDSLGQLSVVLAIEETLRLRITDEATFESLKSIRGIAAYLSIHAQ